MKKYKLEDLVSNGSRARREVRSDLLVGDPSHGYDYGDILDANATSDLIEQKVRNSSEIVIEGVSQNIQDLQNKDEEHDQKITVIENTIGKIPSEFDMSDDNLTIGL